MAKGKVVSLEDRIPKLKEQRRKKANRRLIFLLLLFFLIIICVIYFQSPLSHAKSIIIKGNQMYSTEDIEKISGLKEGVNIWSINRDKVSSDLKEDGGIQSVDISIKFPNNLQITIQENKKVAYLLDGNQYIPVMENGEALYGKVASKIPTDAPIIKNMTKKHAKKIARLSEELNKLPNVVYNAISEVSYTPKDTDSNHITVYMNDGNQVLATLSSFAEKMEHYPSILAQLNTDKKGVIDLEVGSYFKAFDTEEEQGEGEENSEE
ncbi:cell division protein FtsQ/DivIB [Bacillus sp. B1-b2]|uniref:cell division protein FtsQ/DivIB n=1 Tax=Bacillus sp. B1-b2 TaxID=2653201 RepID=UPI0012619D64|nr:FtsQ-type POTRA domain-containing protein [Bacillus sp. B1-b2]KAB7669259.1 FtsQ-type POTRA domain-containing protein [Bacillus sp. B1-b2]